MDSLLFLIVIFALFCLTIVAVVAMARTQDAAEKAMQTLFAGFRALLNRSQPPVQ